MKKDGAPGAPSSDIKRLRAGVPVAVIAHIGARLRIVGAVGLHAIRHVVAAARGRHHLPPAAIIPVFISLVISRGTGGCVVAGAVALGRNGAADDGTGSQSWNKGAAATAAMIA